MMKKIKLEQIHILNIPSLSHLKITNTHLKNKEMENINTKGFHQNKYPWIVVT